MNSIDIHNLKVCLYNNQDVNTIIYNDSTIWTAPTTFDIKLLGISSLEQSRSQLMYLEVLGYHYINCNSTFAAIGTIKNVEDILVERTSLGKTGPYLYFIDNKFIGFSVFFGWNVYQGGTENSSKRFRRKL